MSALVIKESDARNLMRALGADAKAKSPLKQLAKHLNEMPRWVGKMTEPEDATALECFRQVCRAVQDGDTVEVVPEEGGAAPAPKIDAIEPEPHKGNGISKPKAKAKGPNKAATRVTKSPSDKARKPGVIDTIQHALEEAEGPLTADQLLAKLKKAFPDRSADGMMNTVRQVKQDLRKRGLVVVRTDAGISLEKPRKPAKAPAKPRKAGATK